MPINCAGTWKRSRCNSFRRKSCRTRYLDPSRHCKHRCEAAAQTGDADGFASANTQFHRTIVSLASNQTLLKVWDSLEIGMLSRLNLQKNEDKLRSLAEIHQPIVDSLKRGDLKQTGVLLREHAFSFLDDLP